MQYAKAKRPLALSANINENRHQIWHRKRIERRRRVSVPNPTPIFRIVHVDCLPTVLQRGGLHSANHCPADGLPCRTIHNVEIQGARHIRNIPCGPGGTFH